MTKSTLFALAALFALCSTAEAQMGIVNPPALPPGTNPLAVTPFGNSPHPFNNVPPWAPNSIVWTYQVPPQTAVLPMETVQPGSLPPIIEAQPVMLPGYTVTETTRGYIVHEHWGVRRVGTAYYWTYFQAYFVRK